MRLFVTATDTGAGKTAATACLAWACRSRGLVLAVKPVASGVSPGTFGEDAEIIARAAGHAPMTFARYEAALSPHRAAALEGATLDGQALLAFVEGLHAETVLIEGVGGWRVPLGGQPCLWVSDLARASRAKVVVVVPDRIGAINQAMLTVERILADGLPIASVILNRGIPGAPDASRATNASDLRELLAPLGLSLSVLSLTDTSEASSARAAGAALLHDIVAPEIR